MTGSCFYGLVLAMSDERIVLLRLASSWRWRAQTFPECPQHGGITHNRQQNNSKLSDVKTWRFPFNKNWRQKGGSDRRFVTYGIISLSYCDWGWHKSERYSWRNQEYIKFRECLLLFSPNSFVFPSLIKNQRCIQNRNFSSCTVWVRNLVSHF